MKDNNELGVFFAGLVTGILMFMGLLYFTGNTSAQWQDKAVAHGAAEYYLDENYSRQWRWKP